MLLTREAYLWTLYCHPTEHVPLMLFFVFAFEIWCNYDTSSELSEYSLYDITRLSVVL
jgi:hypothetical protein